MWRSVAAQESREDLDCQRAVVCTTAREPYRTHRYRLQIPLPLRRACAGVAIELSAPILLNDEFERTLIVLVRETFGTTIMPPKVTGALKHLLFEHIVVRGHI